MKRIIICCDGTWNNPDDTKQKEGEAVSNVVKMARAIRPKDAKGVEQAVFYDWGIGTNGFLDKLVGGGIGKGIDKNIQDGYRFLVHNFVPSDEIFIFGFSRGAYTARSLVGLIRNCGILKKMHADRVAVAYDEYRSRSAPDVQRTRAFRQKYSREVTVKFLGVWDTVGALGVPFSILKKFNNKKYGFHDQEISSIIKNAYHALAIDERREAFSPTLWKTKEGRKNTAQVWFPGVHSDVGGGYTKAGLSFVALEWMAKKATDCQLSLDPTYLDSIEPTDSRLHDSWDTLYTSKPRKVCQFSPDESVHPSAKERYNTEKQYRPIELLKYWGFKDEIKKLRQKEKEEEIEW
jgi:uncharacterized protein (DUF2235 family)